MFKHLFATSKRTDPRTIVKCNFTGADGTLLENYAWTDPLDVRPGSNQWIVYRGVSASMQISNNQAKALTNTTYSIGINCGTANCTLSEIGLAGSGIGTNIYGLVFRLLDANNYFNAYCNITNVFVITERVGGVNTIRATTGLTYTNSKINVKLNGNSIVASANGTNLTYLSSVHSINVIHGILLFSTSIPTVWPMIDNFLVTVP